MKFAGNPGYRLLQVFLGQSAERALVFEVYMEIETELVCCTCPGWKLRHMCKHSVFVAEQVEIHGGYVAAVMRHDATMTPEVLGDPIAFRQWVYRNASVMMLE